MSNKTIIYILTVFFVAVGLYMTKTAIGKKKWAAKRVLYCIGGLGSLAAGGYCVIATKKI